MMLRPHIERSMFLNNENQKYINTNSALNAKINTSVMGLPIKYFERLASPVSSAAGAVRKFTLPGRR